MRLAAADVVAVTGRTDMWLDADVVVVAAVGRTDMRLASDVVVVVGCKLLYFAIPSPSNAPIQRSPSWWRVLLISRVYPGPKASVFCACLHPKRHRSQNPNSHLSYLNTSFLD